MSGWSCSECGKNASDGAYLVRTSPKGQPFVGKCHPVCGVPWISEDAKLLHAIRDDEGDNRSTDDD